MTENVRTQLGIVATDGSFAQGLKMPVLNAAFSPGHRPGDFGLFNNKVYVRLQNQTVIELGSNTASSWSAVLAVGNVTGGINPTISTGDQILFQSGIMIGGSGILANSFPNIGSIAIGSGSGATGTSNSIAIGSTATASQPRSTAIGFAAIADNLESTALGYAANTTQNGQIMLGNNSIGNTSQVYADVGVSGLLESGGFVVSRSRVQASLGGNPDQSIDIGSTDVTIEFPLVNINYQEDYTVPAIAGVTADRLILRQFRTISGFLNIFATFPDGPALGSTILIVRIIRDNGGIPEVLAQQYIRVEIGENSISEVIPFMGTATVNDFIYATVDNPAIINRIMLISGGTKFVGSYIA